jgi:excisionase family DNA binding protein
MSVISKFEGEILTITDAALAMRCSKTHMQNVLQGRVANVPRLPHIRVGRRVLIRRESFERWMADAESLSGREA